MKNGKDFRKINKCVYGAINFNNMIPVPVAELLLIDFDAIQDKQYRRLLQHQYEYIKEDEYVEVTPKSMRMRKVILDELERKRANRG